MNEVIMVVYGRGGLGMGSLFSYPYHAQCKARSRWGLGWGRREEREILRVAGALTYASRAGASFGVILLALKDLVSAATLSAMSGTTEHQSLSPCFPGSSLRPREATCCGYTGGQVLSQCLGSSKASRLSGLS